MKTWKKVALGCAGGTILLSALTDPEEAARAAKRAEEEVEKAFSAG